MAGSVVLLFFTNVAGSTVGVPPSSKQSLCRAMFLMLDECWCAMSSILNMLDVSTTAHHLIFMDVSTSSTLLRDIAV